MFGRWGKKLVLAGAVVLALTVAPAARAGLIPVSVTVQPDGPNFRWTYGVIVTTDVSVNNGDSFTIYDVGGFIPGTVVAPDGWSASEALTTTPHFGTHPSDDPTLMNLSFTYTGDEPIPGQSGLGNFSALSSFVDATTSDFTSSAHRQVDGRVEDNITTTDVPRADNQPPISETPEPASLAMLGLGLPLAGLFRHLRRRR